jgi:kynureninase
LRTEDIVKTIEEHGECIAVVLLSGVHYFTGQLFDIELITKAAHSKQCYIGWDLAHAAGNVELKLHEWQVDFASWCTYKYLSAGPGSISAIFLHQDHFETAAEERKRLNGWWGHRLETRFQMNNGK